MKKPITAAQSDKLAEIAIRITNSLVLNTIQRTALVLKITESLHSAFNAGRDSEVMQAFYKERIDHE